MPREAGSDKCRQQTPKGDMEAEEPFWNSTLPWLAPHCIRELHHLVDKHNRWTSPSPDRRDLSCSSAELSAVIVASKLFQSSNTPSLPYDACDDLIGYFTDPPIGARPGGEILHSWCGPMDIASAWRRRDRKSWDIFWLGRFPAKPYDGLIFQGSAARGYQAQAPPTRSDHDMWTGYST